MSDRDPLAVRFAAFREASIATTQRPSVATVRRRVARRDATRTAALGVLVALLAGTGLWLTRHTSAPTPTLPPSPTATAQFSDVPDRPSSQSPAPSPSGSSSPAPSHASVSCVPKSGDPAIAVDDPLGVADSTYFRKCPQARVPIWVATYEWDPNRQLYVLAHDDVTYLTAQSPTEPKPGPDLDPISSVCGYGYAFGSGPFTPPGSLPPGMSDSDIDRYWATHYPQALEALWNTHTASELSTIKECQRPQSPTP